MGRVKGTVAEPLMSASEVAIYLLESCESLRNFESFMFGSSLFGVGSDFDILIVGPSGEPLSQLKTELRLAGKELPLDVLYMLPAEAEETGFVTTTGCIALEQLADSEKSLNNAIQARTNLLLRNSHERSNLMSQLADF